MSKSFQVFLATTKDSNDSTISTWFVVRNCVSKRWLVLTIGGNFCATELTNLKEARKYLLSDYVSGETITFSRLTERQVLLHILRYTSNCIRVYMRVISAQRPFPTDVRAKRVLEIRADRILGTTVVLQPLVIYRDITVNETGYKKMQKRLAALTTAVRNKDVDDTIVALQDLVSMQEARRARDTVNDVSASGMLNYELTLADCGHVCRSDDTQTVWANGDALEWCADCFEDGAVFVEDRNEYWRSSDAYHHDDGAYYSYEESCDDYGDDDDDDDGYGDGRDITVNCDDVMQYSANVLSELHSITNLHSSAYGDFTMGVELEMTSGNSGVTSAVRDVRDQLGHKYCIIKSDGSLPENGFEVVTMPAPLSEHIARVSGWDINSTYRAWSTNKCGVHVHIDARAFTKMTLGKFIIFINKEDNEALITKIAGRHPNTNHGASEYCQSEAQHTLASPMTAIKGKSENAARYRMVNLCNIKETSCERLGLNSRHYCGRYDTVELRIFKASMKKERLLAQIEFAHAAVMFVRAASYRDLNESAFIKWLEASQFLYPNLASWFGVRKVKENPRLATKVSEVVEQ